MENKIIKVILSMAQNTLRGIIVQREHTVKKYGYGKISHNQLLEKYSEIARELKKQYIKEIDGLSEQDAINKLYLMGKFQYNRDNLITNVTIYDENTENEKMKVVYEDKTEYINKNNSDYDQRKEMIIKELCSNFDIKDDNDRLNKLKFSGLYKIKTNSEKIEKVIKENKIEKLKIRNKKILSAILAGAITVTGIGIGIAKFNRKNNNSNSFNNKVETLLDKPNDTKVPTIYEDIIRNEEHNNSEMIDIFNSPTISPTSTIKPTTKPTVFETNTIKPSSSPAIIFNNKIKNIHFINENEYFMNYEDIIDSKIIAKKINGFNFYIEKDKINRIIKNMNALRQDNLLNTNDKNNVRILVFYEKLLTLDDEKSKAFVKYFSMIGNEIILNLDNLNNKNDYAILSSSEVIRLIRDNEPLVCYINGKREQIYFSEIEKEAQDMVLNIAWLNNSILTNDIQYNDINISKEKIYDIILGATDPRKNMKNFLNEDGTLNILKYKNALSNWRKKIEDFKSLYNNEFISYPFLDDNMVISNENIQEEYIISNYKSDTNPYKSRYSQGNGAYGTVKFEGSTIRKSGCGICAFSTGVSCALKKAYNTNISINPSSLLKELRNIPERHYYRCSNGLIWGDNSSTISIDITKAFNDISILELKGKTPTFTKENLEMIANMEYPVVVSLNGRGHIVCITKSDGNGKFYVADSDRGYSSPISINTYIVRSDGRRRGTISGKKAWIIVPNKNIEIKGEDIYIEGLDFSKIPTISKFETNGKAFDVSIYNDKLSIENYEIAYDNEDDKSIKK